MAANGIKPSLTLLLALATLIAGCGKDASQQETFNIDDSPRSGTSRGTTSAIWYSTWYANEGKYNWITDFGAGAAALAVGDVDGDGKVDALTYSPSGSVWQVALSTGDGFSAPSTWASGFAPGSSRQFLADVDGDGKADAVAFFAASGTWKVKLSNGSSFASESEWISGHGVGSSIQFLADVNGDGRADAVAYFADTGRIYVALSTGTSFSNYSLWASGLGAGDPLLADVDGDGKADLVMVDGSTGQWRVALSKGTVFNTPQVWITGHGVGSTARLLGDIDGDGKADAIVYLSSGEWWVARSSGAGFASPSRWKYQHAGDSVVAADLTGTGKVSAIAYVNSGAVWKALPADDRFDKPNIYNTWEGWDIRYRPRVRGAFRTYDSGEADVIDEHIEMLSRAGIRFAILDLTNNIEVDHGYILDRAQKFCERLALSSEHDLQFVVAVGGMQFSGKPQTLEDEARKVKQYFMNNPACDAANRYFRLDGKPLLINYSTYDQRKAWESYGAKHDTNDFTVRWATGRLPDSGVTAANEYGLYYGWGYSYGSIPDDDTMVVMPGWNNQKDQFVSRVFKDVPGDFFKMLGWERVLRRKPGITVINSFNEYREETAIAPTDTSGLTGKSEKWLNPSGALDPDFYWNMAVDYLKALRDQQPVAF